MGPVRPVDPEIQCFPSPRIRRGDEPQDPVGKGEAADRRTALLHRSGYVPRVDRGQFQFEGEYRFQGGDRLCRDGRGRNGGSAAAPAA